LLCASTASAGLDIVVSFDDTAEGTWDAVEMGVVNYAISEYESAFDAYDIDEVVNFGIDFRNLGAGVAAVTYGWVIGGVPGTGDSTRPWLGTGHYMGVTPSGLWWDPTPSTDGDVGGNYDALTIIRHELGHMLGVQVGLYFDDYAGPNHTDVWDDKIVSHVFDPGGLAVSMNSGDHSHTNGGLMNDTIYAGQRFDIDQTAEMLMVAFDLDLIPEPVTMSLLGIGATALLIKRRRSA